MIAYVERNLGFEAEHHERALRHIPDLEFRRDDTAQRYGFLTTQPIKYAAVQLLDTMMRENRVHLQKPFISLDENYAKTQIREQFAVYSHQFKQAADTFGKDRQALSGKVGGTPQNV